MSKKSYRSLFLPFDLLLIWLPALLASSACVFAAIKSTTTVARIICIITAIIFPVFIGLFYYCRYVFTECDFTTKYGILVKLGKRNRPSEVTVNMWTRYAIAFWEKVFLDYPDRFKKQRSASIVQSLYGVRVTFIDKPIVTRLWLFLRGMKQSVPVVGLQIGNEVVIGSGYKRLDGLERTPEDIFIHEISHILLGKNGIHPCVNPSVQDGGEAHHKLFKEFGLEK